MATEFDALLHDGQSAANAVGARNGCGVLRHGRRCRWTASSCSTSCRANWPSACAFGPQHPRVAALRDESKLRLGRLVTRAAECVADGRCSISAVLRFIDWIEPLLKRESYLALLVERPAVQQRLLRLLGMARWPMQYLMRHPGVIDELADERLQRGRFDAALFTADLQSRHEAWARSGQASEEWLMDTLRHAHHAELFRTLVRDVERDLTVEQVADDLSALADAVLQTTLRWAWELLRQRHRETPRFAVIAYGKLGGKELGYGSDLDVVFLYDDSDEEDKDRAQEVYGNYVRKLISWLTLRTAAGELFDIDTALRPNGGSGLLVTSIEAFERYQSGRGSNTAWTWEHQAITRARFCAGTPELAGRFEAVRRVVLGATRDAAALRDEIRVMREKVRSAHPVRAGVLRRQAQPRRHDGRGVCGAVPGAGQGRRATRAARQRRQHRACCSAPKRRGLLPAGVGQRAADAYRELRRAQHMARLDEQPTQFEPKALAPQADAVLALWRAVFG